MSETDLFRAYSVLKHFYQHVYTRAPNPSQDNMEKVTGDFRNLYQREESQPPVITLENHVDPLQVNDSTSSETEAAVH